MDSTMRTLRRVEGSAFGNGAALSGRGSPSPPDGSAPSTDSLRPLTRTEPCVCGGSITAIADDWCDIAEAVRRHRLMPEHAAYMAGMRLVREPGTTQRDGQAVYRTVPR